MKLARLLTATFVLVAASGIAKANPQDGGESGPAPAAAGSPQVTVVTVPAPAQPAPQVIVPGYPQPGYNPDAHLPSSSRSTTDTSKGDSFDLLPGGDENATVRGGENASFVLEGQTVPEMHTVRSGDTLWDISGQYYKNPYGWPRLWAQNPQIQNPHWIYPGDQVKLRDAEAVPGIPGMRLAIGGRSKVPPGTVFLRDMGWLDDKNDDNWGEIVGSPADKMLLSEGDDVYLKLRDKKEVALGQQLTIFRPLVTRDDAAEKGQLVSIRGTVRIDRINTETHMAKGHIIESLDVIERGAKLGPVDRRFDVVPPKKSDQDIEAKIVAALYPHAFYGQYQVVFIDKGEKEGVQVGMRFFGLRRGDRWRHTLRGAGKFATVRPVIEDDRPAKSENIEDVGKDEQFPDEVYAELRIVRIREHTATAIVTQSQHEIERGAFVTARKGM